MSTYAHLSRDELEEHTARLAKIVKHVLADNTGAYFICGEAGEKDSMGLPAGILVCPSYGLDGFAYYKMERGYTAPCF